MSLEVEVEVGEPQQQSLQPVPRHTQHRQLSCVRKFPHRMTR